MKSICSRPTALLAATALWLTLPSCKGRTTENMEPSGDTVEVIISGPENIQPDSISTSIDSTEKAAQVSQAN